MQISALNTIIAAQQSRGSIPQRPAVAPAPQDPKAAGPADSFAPLAFKAGSAQAQAAAPASTNPYSPSAPLGSQIDIRI